MVISSIAINGSVYDTSIAYNKKHERLNNNTKITITTSNNEEIVIIGKKGLVIDFASIPFIARFLIDKNSVDMRVAGFVHDICFILRHNSCKWSAKLMIAILYYYNIHNILLIRIIYLCIISPIAKYKFNKESRIDKYSYSYCSINTKQRCE